MQKKDSSPLLFIMNQQMLKQADKLPLASLMAMNGELRLQTEKFAISKKEEKPQPKLLEEWSEGFKRDEVRYRGIRKDLRELESNVKESKRFMSNYKKTQYINKTSQLAAPVKLSSVFHRDNGGGHNLSTERVEMPHI